MRLLSRLTLIGAMLFATAGCATTMDVAMIDMLDDATREPEPPAPPKEPLPETLPEDQDCC